MERSLIRWDIIRMEKIREKLIAKRGKNSVATGGCKPHFLNKVSPRKGPFGVMGFY